MKQHCLRVSILLLCLASPVAVGAEGYSSARPSAPATIYYRAFTIYTLEEACENSPAVASLSLQLRSTRIDVGGRINTNTADDSAVSDLIIEAFDDDGNFIPSVPVYVGAISHGQTRDYDPGVVYRDASMDYWEARLPGTFDVEAGWLCSGRTGQAVRTSVTVEVAGPGA